MASPSSVPTPTAVQSPLNLQLTIQPGQNLKVLEFLAANSAAINAALTQVGTVHFARFLVLPGTQTLFVLTEYDGDFNTYLQAFTNILGNVFDGLLSYMDPAPPLPVQQNVQAFADFVAAHNLPSNLYSAYPNCTVLQILGNACTPPGS